MRVGKGQRGRWCWPCPPASAKLRPIRSSRHTERNGKRGNRPHLNRLTQAAADRMDINHEVSQLIVGASSTHPTVRPPPLSDHELTFPSSLWLQAAIQQYGCTDSSGKTSCAYGVLFDKTANIRRSPLHRHASESGIPHSAARCCRPSPAISS